MQINYEKKHFFIVAAIVMALLSPLVIWFLPYLLHRNIYADGTVWVIKTHAITYRYYGIAVVLLVVAAVISYFLKPTFRLIICIACAALAAFFMYAGLKPITTIGEAGVTLVTSEKVEYSWNDVDEIVLTLNDQTKEQTLEIIFDDNNTLLIDEETENLLTRFMQLIKEYDFPLTTVIE
ncbi:hypothetical protein FIU87_13390 [Bacillus sp. THAF10]|uniref:hypothetical protein n=1 Tax=Bacillus sp. THAF10 TaxID=2587848 RepID=UPI001268AD27|nr:hypothetical protein [Bacillus sp. THAF10]QFT89649.1 hypothetical protein FIU87_13390 [Bacillus sp. THAF10]